MGTITDICKAIDVLAVELNQTNDIDKLKDMWEWMKENRKKYSIIEREFMAEHLGNHVRAWRNKRQAEIVKKQIEEY